MTRRITPTYILLNQITLAAASSSVTFSNIPQNYGDLVLVAAARSNRAATADFGAFTFNGTAPASRLGMVGDGSTASSYSLTNNALFECPGASASAGLFNTAIFHVMDYSATDKHKTIINRDNTQTGLVVAQATRWADTAAISTIAITSFTGNSFVLGSTFSLYGIAA
jgi:hypothetical protein